MSFYDVFSMEFDVGKLDRFYQQVLVVTEMPNSMTVADVLGFFAGYAIDDINHEIDPKSDLKSVAYIMFNTEAVAVAAQAQLDMSMMLHSQTLTFHCVRVARAFSGFTINNEGLLQLRTLESEIDGLEIKAEDAILPQSLMESIEAAANYSLPIKYLVKNYQLATRFYIPGLQATELSQSSGASVSGASTGATSFQVEDENPRYRVLVITNLHLNVKVNDLRPFFSGLEIIDFKRNVNYKTGKPAPIGFVLFKTIANRVEAQKNNDRLLFGRPIKLDIPNNITVWSTGFTRPAASQMRSVDSTDSPKSYLHTVPKVLPARELLAAFKVLPAPQMSPFSPEMISAPHISASAPQIDPLSPVSPMALPSPFMIESPVQANFNINAPVFEAAPMPTKRCITPYKRKRTDSAIESTTWSATATATAVSSPVSEARFSYHDEASDDDYEYDSDMSSTSSSRFGSLPLSFQDPFRAQRAAEPVNVGPWNLNGQDSTENKYNVVTEADWYKFGIANKILRLDN